MSNETATWVDNSPARLNELIAQYPSIAIDELTLISELSESAFLLWQKVQSQREYVKLKYPMAEPGQISLIENLSASNFAIWRALAEHGSSDMCRACLQDKVGSKVTIGTNGSAPLRVLRHLGFKITRGRRADGCLTHLGTQTWQRLSSPLPDISLFKSRALYNKEEWDKIKKVLGSKDSFTGSRSDYLEVDHRVPFGRLAGSENKVDVSSDQSILGSYQALTREHNAQKREACLRCISTGKRSVFLGMPYWYEGDERFDAKLGCNGCGWAFPEKWKSALLESASKTIDK